MAKTELSDKLRLQLFQQKQELNYRNLTSISENEIKEIPYDEGWSQYDRTAFCTMLHCFNSNVYSEYAYCLRSFCEADDKYKFYKIRIYELDSIDGKYILYIAPAIKISEVDMAKVRVPEVVNRLGLVKGKPVEIDDIPVPLTLTFENSYYDAKLKRRILKAEKKEVILIDISTEEPKAEKPKSESKVKEQIVLDNKDAELGFSNFFLSPRVCTRLWILGVADETGWGWFAIDRNRYSFNYYCRPIEIESDLQRPYYDRGGNFITHAYKKVDFESLNKDALSFELLEELWKEFAQSTNAIMTLNCLIDCYLINWTTKGESKNT